MSFHARVKSCTKQSPFWDYWRRRKNLLQVFGQIVWNPREQERNAAKRWITFTFLRLGRRERACSPILALTSFHTDMYIYIQKSVINANSSLPIYFFNLHRSSDVSSNSRYVLDAYDSGTCASSAAGTRCNLYRRTRPSISSSLRYELLVVCLVYISNNICGGAHGYSPKTECPH